jgi:putative phage-type endonuclease
MAIDWSSDTEQPSSTTPTGSGQILTASGLPSFSSRVKVVTMQQGTPAWLEWRRAGIGGSDIPALLKLAKNRTPFSVWTEKLYGSEQEVDFTATRGKYLEQGVAQWAADQMGVRLLGPACVVRTDRPWARCSLDNTFYRSGMEWAGLSVLEVKTDRNYREWENGVPPRVLAQVDWEMYCADAADAEVVVYLPIADEFRHYTVDRSSEREAHIIATAEAFWNEHILTECPPAIDGSDSCTDWLSERFRTYEPSSRPATEPEATVLAAFLAAKEMRKWAERNEKELANQAKAIIGVGEEITWPGGRAIWKADKNGNRRLRILGEEE